MFPDDEMRRYYAGLDKALASLDEKKIRAFLSRWENPLATVDGDVFWCAIHKTITARKTLPMALRSKSKGWLIAHGFKPWDDGDVPAGV